MMMICLFIDKLKFTFDLKLDMSKNNKVLFIKSSYFQYLQSYRHNANTQIHSSALYEFKTKLVIELVPPLYFSFTIRQ